MYNVLNAIGIAVNMIFCVWVAVRRGQLSAQSAGEIPPHSLVMEVKQLYHAVTFLELLSGVLLGDALRRIKKQLNSMPHLMADQRTFWLHVMVLVSHCVIFTIS